ncbi:MAG: YihY/virulence factor BrkB family protein [Eubacterium sp.]|nr:YihY/virulence factor BrkB family protein [Eubacterium sp.]
MSARKSRKTESRTDHIDTAAVRQYGVEIAQGFGSLDVGTYASSIAFFFFLSIIPMLILASGLIPYMGMRQDDLIHAITSITPDIIDELITNVVWESFNRSTRLIPMSFIILIWASSQGTMAMMRGLNKIYRTHDHRTYFELLPISIVYTIIILIMMFVMIFLIFSNLVNRPVQEALPQSLIVQFFTTLGRYSLALIIVLLILTMFYTFLPKGRRNFLHQLPGALLTIVVWIFFSLFFTLYINGTNRYTSFYGSLGTIAIFLFWLYCCSYILLIGGFVNKHFDEYIPALFKRKRHRRNYYLDE